VEPVPGPLLLRNLVAPRKIADTHFCERLVEPRAIARLERLRKLKNPMTSSGIEPATFGPLAQCLNKLCYLAPHVFLYIVLVRNF
jgi:hypothetical protein